MRLLLADDERELTRALEVILSHEGYEVQVADDGREALAYAQAEAYDGYIFDIMMPVMDGITSWKLSAPPETRRRPSF